MLLLLLLLLLLLVFVIAVAVAVSVAVQDSLGCLLGLREPPNPVNYDTKRLRSGLRPNPPPCLCKVTRTNIGMCVCLSVCLSVVCKYVFMYVCTLFCRYIQVSACQAVPAADVAVAANDHSAAISAAFIQSNTHV